MGTELLTPMLEALASSLLAVPAERRTAIIAEAATYAAARVPGALRRFNIDEDGVRDMITARLPSVRNEAG